MFENIRSKRIILQEHLFVKRKIEHIFGIYVCFFYGYVL